MDSLENLPELDCDASRTARQNIIPGRQSPAFKADMSALFFRFLKSREMYVSRIFVSLGSVFVLSHFHRI